MNEESMFWADQEARRVVEHSGEKKEYVCASGVTPSGTTHIGNFREIITVELIVEALQNAGRKTRFIYSWDDFDRFRKIPDNLPEKARKMLEEHLYKPVADVPDFDGCHKSYAEHWQKPLEEDVKALGIKPEFLYQHKLYRKCVYAEGIRTALRERDKIKSIINQYRTEARGENWYPLEVYCEKCNKDTTKITDYNNEYQITYACECGHNNTIDFRKKGIVKPLWRVDWPMRWAYYNEDFEPAGKDHFAAGSSRDTGVQIINQVYNKKEPYGFVYDLITTRGSQKKMSKSKGKIISVQDVTSVYLPEIVRHFFTGTSPGKPFAINLDDDLIKVYDNFYSTEKIFFGKEKVSKRDEEHYKKVYEYAYGPGMKKPEKMPVQPGFRMASDVYQTFNNEKRATAEFARMLGAKTVFDKNRIEQIILRAKNWVENYAPKEYKYELVNHKNRTLTKEERGALIEFSNLLLNDKTEEDVKKSCSKIFEKYGIKPSRFFQTCYQTLFAKEKGPRLGQYIIAHGSEQISRAIKENVE